MRGTRIRSFRLGNPGCSVTPADRRKLPSQLLLSHDAPQRLRCGVSIRPSALPFHHMAGTRWVLASHTYVWTLDHNTCIPHEPNTLFAVKPAFQNAGSTRIRLYSAIRLCILPLRSSHYLIASSSSRFINAAAYSAHSPYSYGVRRSWLGVVYSQRSVL